MLIYKTDGDVQNSSPRNGTDYQLDELQEIVGGYIEVVYLADGRIMVLNEEGKLRGLAYNQRATALFRKQTGITDDFIAGDVLICKEEQLK